MPLHSIVTKTGDGSTTEFNFSFTGGYTEEADVLVRVGTEVAGDGSPLYRPITFLNAGRIQIGGTVPAVGELITIFRQTDITEAINIFSDGVVLNAATLDTSFDQLVKVCQELNDALASAKSAETSADEARAARDTAIAARDAATGASTAATVSQTSAAASASASATSATAAQAAATQAGTSQAAAATSAAQAAQSAADTLNAYDPSAVAITGGTVQGLTHADLSVRAAGDVYPEVVSTDGGRARMFLRSDSDNRSVRASLLDGTVQGTMKLKSGEIAFSGLNADLAGDKYGIMNARGFFDKRHPQYWGAAGDGVTDDTIALRAWFNYIVDNNLDGYVPAGDYVVSGTGITKTVAGRAAFTIQGAGIGVTRFLVLGSGNFLSIHHSGPRNGQATYQGFTVMTDTDTAGVGLRHTYTVGGSQHQRNLIVRDVEVRGNNLTSNRFQVPFDFTGCHRPYLENVLYNGPYHLTTLDVTSARYATPVGIILDGCYDPIMSYCHVWGAFRGVRSHGADSESIRIDNCVFNQVRIGIDFQRNSTEPLMIITHTHINYRDEGLMVDGAKLVQVMGCLIYNEDLSNNYTGTPHDIRLVNCSEYLIRGNQFHFHGNANRVGIFVESDTGASARGNNGIISENMFTFNGLCAVWLSGNVLNVRGKNMVTGTMTNAGGAYENRGGPTNTVGELV